jgi:glycosyltransferase involved in cell wall biosynthesis
MDHVLSPENTTFVLLAFEGPDAYARAGGLGVRVTELSLALAELGYPVHLLFVGDPRAPGREIRLDGRLTLHRWCQWISSYWPAGVYDGEEDKLGDFTMSVPPFVVDCIAGPALEAGRLVVIMGEEWQTAAALSRIADQLGCLGGHEQAVLLWNANNTTGFHRIDWGRLTSAATITTVSSYMKHLMWGWGVNPLVIPNGIPRRLVAPVERVSAAKLGGSLDAETVLVKVARWDPDKRWNMAMDTVARLKADGRRVVMLARGGAEPHGGEVLAHADALGLVVHNVSVEEPCLDGYAHAFQQAGGADVLNLASPISQDMLRLLYHIADGVLANWGHEPFGLVGLEAMAAGGTAYTGHTGEEYVSHFEKRCGPGDARS